ncbi:CBO0543 family protein [Neobacillus sp. SCS-31]|uniref:CBO0543 family protein n=1 Tax=Neobacillus oceani TaxID=3115292 RepID=UPI003906B079
MNMIKSLNGFPSLRFRKGKFIPEIKPMMPAALLGSLLGTYLDLYFTGKGFYSFPVRPLGHIFSINIAFTLIGLPLLILGFLFICKRINPLPRIALILVMSLFMAAMEKTSETLGLMEHHQSWKHIYTFYGYTIFLTIVYLYYKWKK